MVFAARAFHSCDRGMDRTDGQTDGQGKCIMWPSIKHCITIKQLSI